MGFGNKSLNQQIRKTLFNDSIYLLFVCSQRMVSDCKSGKLVLNHEDKITNRLAARYLNKNNIGLRFIPQTQEHFDPETDSYIGRTDFTVIGEDFLRNDNAYYVVECKRIDGSTHMNNEYVKNGVVRFINLLSDGTPKYSSYYRQSIMFGYVVQAIDIPQNAAEIDGIQRTILKNIPIGLFSLVQNFETEFFYYSCQYETTVGNIDLAHLFFDFSEVVCGK